jgi:hypothetical protein
MRALAVHDIVETADDGLDALHKTWTLAKMAAIGGYSYLMIRNPVQTLRFTWWAIYYVSVRAVADTGVFLGEMWQQIRQVHGWDRTRPPPGPLSPFILLGIPLIVAITQAGSFLGSDSDTPGGCQESLFMPGQCQVV